MIGWLDRLSSACFLYLWPLSYSHSGSEVFLFTEPFLNRGRY